MRKSFNGERRVVIVDASSMAHRFPSRDCRDASWTVNPASHSNLRRQNRTLGLSQGKGSPAGSFRRREGRLIDR